MSHLTEYPPLTKQDFATQLATLREFSRVSLFKLAQSKDSNICLYVLGVLGVANITDRQLFQGEFKKLEEVRTRYLPFFLKSEGEQGTLSWVDGSELVKECPSMTVRIASILYCLQRHIITFPMPLPQARWWQLHEIKPLPQDSPNMHMGNFLTNIGHRYVTAMTLLHEQFGSEDPEPLALSPEQWIDLCLYLGRYRVKAHQTVLHMLVEWGECTPCAKPSVLLFCTMLRVTPLFKAIPGLPSRSSKIQNPDVFQRKKDECKFDSTTPSYPEWEFRQIVEELFRAIFNVTGPLVAAQFYSFFQICQDLNMDVMLRSMAVFFIQQVQEQYREKPLSNTHPDYYSLMRERFQEKVRQLNQLICNERYPWDKANLLPVKSRHPATPSKEERLHDFLLAALIVTHLSSLKPLGLNEMLEKFGEVYRATQPQLICDALLEHKVPRANPSELCPVNLEQLAKMYRFSLEERVILFLHRMHYEMRLRNGCLVDSQPTLDFAELIRLLGSIEDCIYHSTPPIIAYNLLRLQFLTKETGELIGRLVSLRQEISKQAKQKFIPHLYAKLEEELNRLDAEAKPHREKWNSLDKALAQMVTDTLKTLLRNSTLLCNGLQTPYACFLPGMINEDGGGFATESTPVERWCAVYQGMLRSIQPGDRAIKVDGFWKGDTRFELQMMLFDVMFHDASKVPAARRAAIILEISRSELAADKPLCQLLPPLLHLLCEEAIPLEVNVVKRLQANLEFQGACFQVIKTLYAQNSGTKLKPWLSNSRDPLTQSFNLLLNMLYEGSLPESCRSNLPRVFDKVHRALLQKIRTDVKQPFNESIPFDKNPHIQAFVKVLTAYFDEQFKRMMEVKEGADFLEVLFHNLSAFPAFESLVSSYRQYMENDTGKKRRNINALAKYADQLKEAIRRMVLDISSPIITPVGADNYKTWAAKGDIWEGKDSELSLLPVSYEQPIQPLYGICRADYRERLKSFIQQLRGDARGTIQGFCQLKVANHRNEGIKKDIFVDFQRMVMTCPLEKDLFKITDIETETCSFYQVTMGIVGEREALVRSRYLIQISDEDLLQMLLGQLLELKAAWYRHGR